MSAINIDQNNIQSEVMNSDKPVLLDFWAPWCGPCRMVVPIVEEIARERASLEEEIASFIPEEYWSLDAMLKAPGSKKPAAAHFHNDKDGKTEIKSKAELDALLESLKGQKFIVTDIRNGERTKKPPLPFTTSTLQQEASKALNFSTQKTMRLAQQLYEGVDVKGHGTVGLITYLRTDSTRVAEEAEKMASDFIAENYGENYLSQGENTKKNSGKIQDAHEAIRPAYMDRTGIEGSPAEKRLYDLIWKRTIASQMASAQTERTVVDIAVDGTEERFVATGEVVLFDGFLRLYSESTEDEPADGEEALLPPLKKGDRPQARSITASQRFTQSPPRYSEASLVKRLEELGIGRPST